MAKKSTTAQILALLTAAGIDPAAIATAAATTGHAQTDGTGEADPWKDEREELLKTAELRSAAYGSTIKTTIKDLHDRTLMKIGKAYARMNRRTQSISKVWSPMFLLPIGQEQGAPTGTILQSSIPTVAGCLFHQKSATNAELYIMTAHPNGNTAVMRAEVYRYASDPEGYYQINTGRLNLDGVGEQTGNGEAWRILDHNAPLFDTITAEMRRGADADNNETKKRSTAAKKGAKNKTASATVSGEKTTKKTTKKTAKKTAKKTTKKTATK